jgi:hypothetical protein
MPPSAASVVARTARPNGVDVDARPEAWLVPKTPYYSALKDAG